MVPVVGLEPTRPRGQQILSLSRLPIPTHRQNQQKYYNIIKTKCQVLFAEKSADKDDILIDKPPHFLRGLSIYSAFRLLISI